MSTRFEPTWPDTPFSQSLLDKLDIVWEHRDRFNAEEAQGHDDGPDANNTVGPIPSKAGER